MNRITTVAILLLASGLSSPLLAQDTAGATPNATISLRYLELTNREAFQFRVPNKPNLSKPVGDMNFDFPTGTFASNGFDPSVRTFCVEPLVPIYAGKTYKFQIDPVNDPKGFGYPDDDTGREIANRKATYIRELYGRYYQDSLDQPKSAAPAFQAAIWEIAQETEIPEGPVPFNLFTGTFRANYPNEAEAPEYVRTAQRYLQSLTGDDAPFRENPALQGMELVRLTGLPGEDGFTPQSQLALRTALGNRSGGMGPLDSGVGSAPGSGPLRFAPAAGGAGGIPGGSGVPFVGSPGTTGSPSVTTFATTQPTSTPTDLTPGTDSEPSSSGPSTTSPSNPSQDPLTPDTPTTPNTPNTPNNPNTPDNPNNPPNNPPDFGPSVPAPPAVWLALAGVGIVAVRFLRNHRKV